MFVEEMLEKSLTEYRSKLFNLKNQKHKIILDMKKVKKSSELLQEHIDTTVYELECGLEVVNHDIKVCNAMVNRIENLLDKYYNVIV